MKTYGIYLAYSPRIDLRADGLGRHLIQFLKGIEGRDDVRFVIACPSWMRTGLSDAFKEAGISAEEFEIIGPVRNPPLYNVYEAYLAYRKRARTVGRSRFAPLCRLSNLMDSSIERYERSLAKTRSPIVFWALAVVGLLVLPVALTHFAIKWALSLLTSSTDTSLRKRLYSYLGRLFRKIRRRTNLRPDDQPLPEISGSESQQIAREKISRRLYSYMEEAEFNAMIRQINARGDVQAWYSPTAFWHQINSIRAPRLICVPDVVLTEFPAAFAAIGGEALLRTFRSVEETIRNGQHFVTYSEHVKQETLVSRFQLPPDVVTVVPHGVTDLSATISVANREKDPSTQAEIRNKILLKSFKKAMGLNLEGFANGEVHFLFYASQFRPNKNVISLLRAYDHLLKRRFIGHKLILTGDPNAIPEIREFIKERRLSRDVLCLYGLTEEELSTCYHLADLAINPSLSEGGCPFTLTEALSVGTPVVMSRIPVTEAIVTDPALRDMMLFDGYDWKDMAARIEWALNNRDTLLTRELELYEILKKRTWRHVVDEHIAILDRISEQPN
ncbi:MAG: glycosyltransferase [Xanthobacteraceae bacterium]|nr:glycosyltransferase [Xanthobacteraceae bacterium]